MAEAEQLDGLTETETQFFESGGEEVAEELQPEAEPEPQESEPEAEQAEQEEKPAEPEQQQDEKLVPLAALHEARAKNRELRERQDAMEERFKQVMEKLEKSGEPPPPSFEEDPEEATKWQLEQIQKKIDEQAQFNQQQVQTQAQREQEQKLIEMYQQDGQRFTQQKPDFMDAYQHMYNSRVNELAAYGNSQAEISEIIKQEEIALAAQAFQDGRSPAEVLYQIAQARGYTPKQIQAQQNAQETKNPEAEKLEMAAKGVEASRSLSNAGGKSEQELSLEALAEMDDDEFEKNWDKMIRG